GDFQPGDRIFLRVEGEQQLSDTFTVGPGQAVVLPEVGAVPLDGVLRSELQGRLQQQLARVLRHPIVQARSLFRVLVEGNVAKAGFYAVPPELPLADLVTAAGGLTPHAKLAGTRVERARQENWSGELAEPSTSSFTRGSTTTGKCQRPFSRTLACPAQTITSPSGRHHTRSRPPPSCSGWSRSACACSRISCWSTAT